MEAAVKFLGAKQKPVAVAGPQLRMRVLGKCAAWRLQRNVQASACLDMLSPCSAALAYMRALQWQGGWALQAICGRQRLRFRVHGW